MIYAKKTFNFKVKSSSLPSSLNDLCVLMGIGSFDVDDDDMDGLQGLGLITGGTGPGTDRVTSPRTRTHWGTHGVGRVPAARRGGEIYPTGHAVIRVKE